MLVPWRLPSSHGSSDGDGGDAADVRGPEPEDQTSPGEDGFDSGEFREWLRHRAERRRGEPNGSRRSGRRADRERDSDDGQSSYGRSRGSGHGPPST